MTATLHIRPPKNPVHLDNQRILITGAGGSLGAEFAEQAAAAGAELVLLDRDIKALEKLHDDIEANGYAQPALYPLDLMGASPDDFAELAHRLQESLGGLDALVHAAADIGEPAPLALYEPQAWLKCLHVNLNAAFLLTQALLPLLRENEGRVIYVSDGCGREGQAAMGAYGVSKWAVEGLMATLAAEHSAANPILTCSIDPGPLRSRLRRQLFAGEMADEAPTPRAAGSGLLALLDPTQPPVNGGRYQLEREQM